MYYHPKEDDGEKTGLMANGVPIRVVFGSYCAQIDESNVAMIRHVYDGDDVSSSVPFDDDDGFVWVTNFDSFCSFVLRSQHPLLTSSWTRPLT